MTTKAPNVAVSNTDALLALTLTLPGKWTHTAAQVQELAVAAEKKLDMAYVPMSRRKGVTATHTFRGPVAKAYGFSVNGSIVTLRRSATEWRVIGFDPKRIFPQQGGVLNLQITPEQEAAAVSAMHRACGIVVRREAARQHVASTSPAEAVEPLGLHHAAELLPEFNR